MDTYSAQLVRPEDPRFEPLLVRVDRRRFEPVELAVEKPDPLERVRFRPVEWWVCVYGTNSSPRDRMRHDAMACGERCLTHRYTRIG